MKEGKNNKVKLALVISAILFVPMLYPQTISKAQNTIGPSDANASQQKVDDIEAERSKTIDSALKVASTLPAMSEELSHVVKCRKLVNIKVKVIKPTVVLRYHGDVFEADVETYKGYMIVNVDRFLAAADTPILQVCTNDTCTELPKQPLPTKKMSWFNKLFHHK